MLQQSYTLLKDDVAPILQAQLNSNIRNAMRLMQDAGTLSAAQAGYHLGRHHAVLEMAEALDLQMRVGVEMTEITVQLERIR